MKAKEFTKQINNHTAKIRNKCDKKYNAPVSSDKAKKILEEPFENFKETIHPKYLKLFKSKSGREIRFIWDENTGKIKYELTNKKNTVVKKGVLA